jgi:hypothetical protein
LNALASLKQNSVKKRLVQYTESLASWTNQGKYRLHKEARSLAEI